MKTFRYPQTLLALLVIAAVPTYGAAQDTATPTSRAKVETAPFIGLRVNMVTKSVANPGTIVTPQQAIASYEVTPRATAITTAPSVARAGTYPPTLSVNSGLFEVSLDGTTGYCAIRAPDHGVRRSQCFVDLNNDNKFDASYISNRLWLGKSLYWGQIASLAAIPSLPYQTTAVVDIDSEPLTYFFKRIRNQKAEFQVGLGARNNGLPVKSCAIDGVTACRLGNHAFVLEAAQSGIRVISVSEVTTQTDITFDR
jgi:hypothetical protein